MMNCYLIISWLSKFAWETIMNMSLVPSVPKCVSTQSGWLNKRAEIDI